jgi:hypothetical protein
MFVVDTIPKDGAILPHTLRGSGRGGAWSGWGVPQDYPHPPGFPLRPQSPALDPKADTLRSGPEFRRSLWDG